MKDGKIEVKDIDISISKSLENSIKKAIDMCKLQSIVPQEFDYHICEDQIFRPENLTPYTIFFVFKRLSATTIYDNDVVPYMVYVYVNNEFIDYAKLILDVLVDMYSGVLKEKYITYFDKATQTVETDLMPTNVEDFKNEHPNYDANVPFVYTWLSETFEKATILNNMVPAGINYYATLYMSTTFVLNKNVLSLDISRIEYTYNDNETTQKMNLDVIQASLDFSIVHDTQPFYLIEKENGEKEYDDFGKSSARYGIFTLSLIIPLKNNPFVKKIFEIVMARNKKETNVSNINSDFIFTYYLIDGMENYNNVFKLSSFNYVKTLDDADAIKIDFTN